MKIYDALLKLSRIKGQGSTIFLKKLNMARLRDIHRENNKYTSPLSVDLTGYNYEHRVFGITIKAKIKWEKCSPGEIYTIQRHPNRPRAGNLDKAKD